MTAEREPVRVVDDSRLMLVACGMIDDHSGRRWEAVMSCSSRGLLPRMVWSVAVVSGVLVLAGCGGSGDGSGPGASDPVSATLSTTMFPCAPAADDCSPEQVIATVAALYRLAGATHAEATCLAPVTGAGKHAVNEAFGVPTQEQTKQAIECVGSEARFRTIATSLARYFEQHPYG